MKKLTKSDILEGSKKKEIVHIDELDGDIEIRPLTFGELSRLSTMAEVPLSPDGAPDVSQIDYKEMATKNFDFIKQVVSLGVVGDYTLTPDEVDKMQGTVPIVIATRILELSGWVSEEAAKKKE